MTDNTDAEKKHPFPILEIYVFEMASPGEGRKERQ
jgi:hypothetical protein